MNWIEPTVWIVLMALLLDLIMGDLPNRFHPVAWMGSYIKAWVSKIPAPGASRQFICGLAMLASGIVLFSLPFWVFSAFFHPNLLLQTLLMTLLLKPAFSLKGLLEAGMAAEDALKRGDLGEARRLTSWHLVSRPTADLDENHVASAVIESLAENVCDSIVAPLLAFLLGGLPAAWAYRFVNTADAMIGYHDAKYEYFGKSAAVLDDILNYLPARLSGGLLCLAAGLIGEDGKNAWWVMLRDHRSTASPNSGWTMSAAAGALNVCLKKKGNYCLNAPAGLPEVEVIGRARRLILVCALLWVLLSVLIALII